MEKFINLNNTHIINISEIQSIELTKKEIGTLYAGDDLANRYTQMTGEEVPDYPGARFKGTYDQIDIELKSGHTIIIKDFDLNTLKEFLLASLESVTHFECAGFSYLQPDSNVTINGEVEVNTHLKTGDYPLELTLSNYDPINIKVEK